MHITDLYKVTKGKVTYKRNKFGISIRDKVFQDFIGRSNEIFEELNSDSKERLLKRDNIEFSNIMILRNYMMQNLN